MRSPSDFPTGPRRIALNSRRFWTGLGVAILLFGFTSLRSLAIFWTDQMWFSQGGFGSVFNKLLFVKAELLFAFGAVFFFLMWGNLLLTNKFGARVLSFEPEDEIIRRFQNVVRPYARRIYAAIAFLMALVAGFSATSQWNSYLLFANTKSFGKTDPLFHKDISFYVMTLPFLRFVVTWLIVALVVVLLVTTVFHYLNGGIRATRVTPRVSPQVKAHLSVIGAGIALLKAAGYLIARFELVNSTNGFAQGAGYTDVHARMPALTILTILSLTSAAILLANVRSRGWSLPAVAVGLWVFVSLIIGVLYPTILQALKVSPAQQTLEAPYIARNIASTRDAFDLNKVQFHNFAGSPKVSASEVKNNSATLSNIRLWDPAPDIALTTVTRLQSIRSYYNFTTLSVDRYEINGKATPVLIGARQLNQSALPSPSWVNTHLQYTHGVGAAVIAANAQNADTGNPIFNVTNVPPVSSNGMPTLSKPGIYFGINDPGWVVTNTKQAELDYQITTGANAGQPVETHYSAKGGVAVGGIGSKLALALRLGDFNFLISNQITSKSRILFNRDVMQMATKAAPFLTFDSQPYAVISNGSVNYILDGYTSTDQYPYSQNANNLNVNEGGLPASFNYARNSVKVVVDSYTGKMTFYVMDPKDPILKSYSAAFPAMFKPLSQMPAAMGNHLRYPSNLFAVQAATLGHYHITKPSSFYSASDKWGISPTTGAGSPGQTLAQTVKTDSQGNIVSTSLSPMNPIFQVGSLPFVNKQQLLSTLAFVPSGNSTAVQGLTAFMIATSDRNDYGKLNVYVAPRGTSVLGPVQADSEIQQNAVVSAITTPLDQHGSTVLLGNTLMVPLNKSILYVRPMYVSSTSNPLPQLKYVIAVFNQNVAISPTLSGALSQVVGGTISSGTSSSGTSTSGGTGSTKPGGTAASYLKQAAAYYSAAQKALSAGNLGEYQNNVNAMNQQLTLAQNALSGK